MRVSGQQSLCSVYSFRKIIQSQFSFIINPTNAKGHHLDDTERLKTVFYQAAKINGDTGHHLDDTERLKTVLYQAAKINGDTGHHLDDTERLKTVLYQACKINGDTGHHLDDTERLKTVLYQAAKINGDTVMVEPLIIYSIKILNLQLCQQ